MMQRIFPSIMAKDQQELSQFFRRLSGVAKILHLDIADHKFVPNSSLNFPLHLSREFKYNAHLMIQHPEQWIKKNSSKVNLCIVHWETIKDAKKFIAWMQRQKKKIAVALKPETNVKEVAPFLQEIDYILILTVHPGFYGRKYLPSQLNKIAQLKKINQKVKVIVDGGMNPTTIRQAARAGADFFITGSYTTKAEDPRKALKILKKALIK